MEVLRVTIERAVSAVVYGSYLVTCFFPCPLWCVKSVKPLVTERVERRTTERRWGGRDCQVAEVVGEETERRAAVPAV